MKKMNFDEFTKAVAEKIREFLPETFASAAIELQTVIKNNDLALTGLLIRSGDSSNVCPMIYLEQFYDDYEAGEELGTVMERIAEIRICHDVRRTFDCDQITVFELARGHIVPRLIGRDLNAQLLEDRPHTDIADLSVTYHVLLDHDDNGLSSAAVTYSLLETWGVDTETLHELAVRNMRSLLPGTFLPISAVICNLVSVEPGTDLGWEDELMFVLSNRSKMYGAASVLDPELMTDIMAKLKKDFYILPSSVHEILIVPVTDDMDKSQLTDMVQSVNETILSAEDILSNNVYRYTLKEGLILA